MFCQNCGKQITDDAIFCGYCGDATPTVDYNIVENHITEENITDGIFENDIIGSNITDSKQAGNYYLSNAYPDDGIVVNTDITPLYSDVGKTAVPNIKKKSNKIKAIFFIIFAFVLVISGVSSGYFVAKNGWDYKTWGNNHSSSDIISEGYSNISDEADENNSSEEKEKSDNPSESNTSFNSETRESNGSSGIGESGESVVISDSGSYDNMNSIIEMSGIISN